MLSLFTTVAWLLFAACGTASLRAHNVRAEKPHTPKEPTTIERINVNVLRSTPAAAQVVKAVPQLTEPIALPPAPMILSTADPVISVAPPAAISAPAKALANNTLSHPQLVQRLTLGEGEGDQPAPEYPREAKLAHQQGSVIIRMTIDQNGDVTDAQISSPSPWPILNQAALRAVRDSWHFSHGSVRYRDIEFVFKLHQN